MRRDIAILSVAAAGLLYAVLGGGFGSADPADRWAVEWHPQIHRAAAEADGLTPADFTWMRYPCSDPRLTLNDVGPRRAGALAYHVSLPADTPQLNQYIAEAEREPGVEYEPVAEEGWLKIPDPEGVSALSRVVFELVDMDTGETLDRDVRASHVDGAVVGFGGGDGDALWRVLTPGGSVRVRLQTHGVFFPHHARGDGGLQYAATGNGYVTTPRVDSEVYTLTMGVDGDVAIETRAGF